MLRRCLEGRNTSFRRVRAPSRAPYFFWWRKLQASPVRHSAERMLGTNILDGPCLETGDRIPATESNRILSNQRIAKGAGGKGPRQKTSKIVKKCQKVFRQFSRRAKNVKNRQKVSKSFSTLFDNFRAAPFFRPLLQSADPKKGFCAGIT